jgi:uncharacterized membrane protein YgcG
MRAPDIRTVALRGVAVITATLVLAAMVGAWGASTADATSYRFWAYWLGSDTGWSFSNQGASRRPADGAVEGWRFAISEASSSTTPPRHTASFARLCGSTAPQEGKKRVGLVVDFGTAADAPDGESPPALIATCVVAPADANGYAVLAAAVQLRTEAGLICGMNGYPAAECGVPVADPTASPSGSPTKGSGAGGGSTGGGGDASDGGSSEGGGDAAPDGQRDDPSGNGTSSTDKGNDSKKKSGTKKEESMQAVTDTGDEAAAAPVDASPAAASSASANGSPIGLLIGLGVVAGLLAAAFFTRRRRA